MQPTLTVLSRTAQRHPAKQPLSQEQSGAVGTAVARYTVSNGALNSRAGIVRP